MDEVQKGSDPKCNVPWSESFRVENDNVSTNFDVILTVHRC